MRSLYIGRVTHIIQTVKVHVTGVRIAVVIVICIRAVLGMVEDMVDMLDIMDIGTVITDTADAVVDAMAGDITITDK